MTIRDALLSLAGLSLGDAFGQSFYHPDAEEKIARRELMPAPWHWTDDTQMALSVVEELQKRDWIDQEYLARHMAWRYTIDPARGYGHGTSQVLERIAHGEYFRSVSTALHTEGSYGTSVAARAVPIGAYFAYSTSKAIREARLAAAVTHLHPEALAAAEVVAVAAVLASQPNPRQGNEFLQELVQVVPSSEIRERLTLAIKIPKEDLSRAVELLCSGEKMKVHTTVPFALWCAAHHLDNMEEALWTAVVPPASRDSVCAVVGGIVALATHRLPEDWLARCEAIPEGIASTAADALTLDGEKQEGPGVSARKKEHTTGRLEFAREEDRQPFQQTSISIQVDALTGAPNLISLLNWFNQQKTNAGIVPFSLAVIHLAGLWDMNRTYGRTAGDDLLRQAARALSSRSEGKVFRSGGDKFAILLDNADRAAILAHASDLSLAVTQPELRLPRAAVIYFTQLEQVSPGQALACMDAALNEANFVNNDGRPREFEASAIHNPAGFPWMMIDIADQILKISQVAMEASRQALTDSISQLPNQRAAMIELDNALNMAYLNNKPLAVLMADGDNLRQYNLVSYDEGDKAIQLISSSLRGQLRATDFLARWRTGDEFLIILPDTNLDQAIATGVRLCEAVAIASRLWLFPTTISIGVAVFPAHGPTVQELLNVAENGLDRAKNSGKNQVIVADD